MKVMFVHGIGFHEAGDKLPLWVAAWSTAIRSACEAAGFRLRFDDPLGAARQPGGPGGDPGILYYEELIRQFPAPLAHQYLQAVGELLTSYVATKAGALFSRDRGRFLGDEAKWKARQVAAWVHNDELRAALRRRVVDEIRAKDPDVVVAHSYGGLITYDACIFEDPQLLAQRYYVTLGTQIGHPLVRREFAGRQLPIEAKHWFNLHNPGDPVFVASLAHIRAENFTNLEVAHPHEHDATAYLGHPSVAANVWRPISEGRSWLTRSRSVRREFAKATRPNVHRALLVGIDEYANPEAPPLKGCVNDTYQLSAALQESGVGHTAIRMLHNGRATRDKLLDGLQWLLEDARPGDHRFFSFSGHGHRMAAHDITGQPAELEEILVTHDYAFTHDTGLRDRDFQDLYAHLPREVHFLIFLDCCHSGGITRSGGPAVRSFTGPADLEHEYLRWDAGLQMWRQHGLADQQGLNPAFLPGPSAKVWRKKRTARDIAAEHALYYGRFGDTRRIGRATPLRDLPHDKFDRISQQLRGLHPAVDSGGPYLPIVFTACGEDEQASEYVHGSVSFGAFTYALVQALRDTRANTHQPPTYEQLLKAATAKLERLGYTQHPEILGNPRQLRTTVPFANSATIHAASSGHGKHNRR